MPVDELGQLSELLTDTPPQPYSDVVRKIERDTRTRIYLELTPKDEFSGQALIFSRLGTSKWLWPKRSSAYLREHFIVADCRLNTTQLKVQFAHELCHILQHDPLDPARAMGPNNTVQYSDEEEEAADRFAVRLLASHDGSSPRAGVLGADEVSEILDENDAWPTYLGREQTLAAVKSLSE